VTIERLDDPFGDRHERPVSREQISALRTSGVELRRRRRSLIATLRASMDEMHSNRERLRRGSRLGTADASMPQPPARERLQRDYGLTPREAEVALLLAQGLANASIARRLDISPHTARHHTQRVLGKLGVHSRAAAAARLRS